MGPGERGQLSRRGRWLLGLGLAGLGLALVASWPLLVHAWYSRPAPSDAELAGAVAVPSFSPAALQALVEADQAARQGEIDWERLRVEDARRRVIVRAWLAAHAIQAPADQWGAALLLQHGRSVEDFELAHRLAAAAAAAGFEQARWLEAASEDRWRLARGLPQRWGTQYQEGARGMELAPVDPATTDAERAARGLPSLAEARAGAAFRH